MQPRFLTIYMVLGRPDQTNADRFGILTQVLQVRHAGLGAGALGEGVGQEARVGGDHRRLLEQLLARHGPIRVVWVLLPPWLKGKW